jgi:hypothetical protein
MLWAMRRKSAWKTASAGIAVSLALTAQTPRGTVEFDAVSIKPADSGAPAHMSQHTQAGFRGRNLRLFELIMSAWHLNRDQIVGVINLSFAPFDPGASADDAGPSIFQALQEEAGLKLEPTKGPVVVLVIDHAERPQPD